MSDAEKDSKDEVLSSNLVTTPYEPPPMGFKLRYRVSTKKLSRATGTCVRVRKNGERAIVMRALSRRRAIADGGSNTRRIVLALRRLILLGHPRAGRDGAGDLRRERDARALWTARPIRAAAPKLIAFLIYLLLIY